MQPERTYTHIDILTFYVLHDHAEVSTGFERTEHGDDKGILCEGEDVSFHKGLLDLVPQDQVLLIDLLHGKSLAGLQVTHQVHSAGANADTHIQYTQIIFYFMASVLLVKNIRAHV